MHAAARWLPTLAVALAAACSRPAAGPGAGIATNEALGVPDTAPSLVGVVAAVEADGRVLLEQRPAPADCAGRAVVSLGPDTRIVWRSGAAARATDVTAGRLVSAWFTGPALRSCPVQVGAAALVLEPTSR